MTADVFVQFANKSRKTFKDIDDWYIDNDNMMVLKKGPDNILINWNHVLYIGEKEDLTE